MRPFVERVRLLAWGETVGLSKVKYGDPNASLVIDPRLTHPQYGEVVMKLLGCIQHIFDDTDALERKYGMKDEAYYDPIISSLTSLQSTSTDPPLSHIFKSAYKNLRSSARNYQQSTNTRKKTVWAIADKTRFQKLVTEIKEYNDSLVSLFPDVTVRTANTLRRDVEDGEEIRPLQLLEQAEQGEISDTASVRLVNLRATAAASLRDEAESVGPARRVTMPQVPEALSVSPLESDDPVEAINSFVRAKNHGAISAKVNGNMGSARRTASVTWEGESTEPHFSWNEKYKGFVEILHPAHGTL